ncbi:hypothetical protein F503_05590 [Ophiostoma piceae UAMH 11346]|uniref:Mid2 domain-containing protein n=1 Tax=Ophiostoma piceae (strain UAMH 11346) TaxID=1262450 RepID=S3DAD4_OPHP1|nr:hypothetical protein F503_05590 [Ophiostoma piceae UAMH 11346]
MKWDEWVAAIIFLYAVLVTFTEIYYGTMSLRSSYGKAAVFLAALYTLPHLVVANANAACYNPTGTLALGYYPCDATAYITNCCASGWTCFSNSLCVVTTASESYPNLTMGAVERAMCTNPMWNNDICGDFCITGSDNSDGEMVACGDNHFCCLGDYNAGLCNCTTAADGSTDGDSFVVNDGRAQTIIDVTASFTGTVSYLTSQPTPSPTTSGSVTHGGNSNTVSGGSHTATPTNTGTSTNTATPASEPKKTNTLAIGLGVGLGVGAIALAGAGYFAYRAWQRRHGGFGRGSFSRQSLPTDLALDGTDFGEQMAMNPNAYNRGIASHVNLDVGHDFQHVPLPPPPQPRAGA